MNDNSSIISFISLLNNGSGQDVYADGHYEQSNDLATTALFLLGTWTILANSFVALCFVISQYGRKNSANVQVLSLSITDIFVGISVIIISFSYYKRHIFRTYNICAIVFLSYVMAQLASIFHILVISLNRFMTVLCGLMNNPVTNNTSKLKVAVQLTCVLVFSLIAACIPFFMYGKFGENLNVCSLNTLFGINYFSAILINNVLMLVPQISINILYFVIYLRLRSTWTAVGPAATLSNVDADIQVIHFQHMPQTKVGSLANKNPDGVTGLQEMNKAAIENRNNLSGYTSGNKMSTKHCPIDNEASISANNIVRLGLPLNKPGGSQSTRSQRSNHKGLRGVFLTVGIILIIMNVCITPLGLLFVIEKVTVDLLSRKLKFTIVALSLMNSAINPVVYAFRVKAFRETCKQMKQQIVTSLCCCKHR